MILLYAVAAGLLLGLVGGGRISGLADVHVRAWPLAVCGLIFQLALFGPLAGSVGSAGPALYVGSTAVVLVALLLNLDQPGFRLIALGAVLNLAVILANGGLMPTSLEAWTLAHGSMPLPAGFTNSVLIGPGTLLPWLADVLALPPPIPLANVFSIGDVLIGVGGGLFVYRLMRDQAEVSALPS